MPNASKKVQAALSLDQQIMAEQVIYTDEIMSKMLPKKTIAEAKRQCEEILSDIAKVYPLDTIFISKRMLNELMEQPLNLISPQYLKAIGGFVKSQINLETYREDILRNIDVSVESNGTISLVLPNQGYVVYDLHNYGLEYVYSSTNLANIIGSVMLHRLLSCECFIPIDIACNFELDVYVDYKNGIYEELDSWSRNQIFNKHFLKCDNPEDDMSIISDCNDSEFVENRYSKRFIKKVMSIASKANRRISEYTIPTVAYLLMEHHNHHVVHRIEKIRVEALNYIDEFLTSNYGNNTKRYQKDLKKYLYKIAYKNGRLRMNEELFSTLKVLLKISCGVSDVSYVLSDSHSDCYGENIGEFFDEMIDESNSYRDISSIPTPYAYCVTIGLPRLSAATIGKAIEEIQKHARKMEQNFCYLNGSIDMYM